MFKGAVNVNDLEPATLKKLKERGLKVPRKTDFSKENVRSWSLKVLALMSELTQDQRRRVLDHAQRVNTL